MENQVEKERLQELIADLSTLCQTPGWQKLVKPAAQGGLHARLNAIVYGGAKDKDNVVVPLDELKAQVKLFNWILEWEVRLEQAVKDLTSLIEAERATEQEKEYEPAGTVHDPRLGLGEL